MDDRLSLLQPIVGGFVSIDMLERFLPKIISTLLTLFLLIISLFVLIIGLELGLKHINAGWIFNSASIKNSI